MGTVTAEEISSLQREFDWVLNEEVDNVIKELKAAFPFIPKLCLKSSVTFKYSLII